MIKRLLNNIGQHKSKWNFGLFFISGLVLIFLLMALVNNINSDIEEKNNKIIAGVQHTVKSLQTTHVSVENKMYFLPEAVSTLSNLVLLTSRSFSAFPPACANAPFL